MNEVTDPRPDDRRMKKLKSLADRHGAESAEVRAWLRLNTDIRMST